MADIQAGRVVVTLEGKDVGLSQIVSSVMDKMNAGVSVAKQYDQSIQALDKGQQRAQASIARYGQALAQQQVSAGNTAGAISVLKNTLDSLNPSSQAAVSVQTRLIQVMNQEAIAAERDAAAIQKLQNEKARLNQTQDAGDGGAKEKSSLSAVEALSKAYVGLQIAKQAAALINTGVDLERTRTQTEVLTKTTERYNEVMAIAKSQQEKYGGSLQDTLESLNSFIPISEQSGASLEKLENLSRRLAAVDPVQGFKGASIALKEFVTGDITSLARRFEIPRDALNEIRNSGADVATQIEMLDGVLTKFGASQALLDAQGQGLAGTYDRLKGSFADLGAGIGLLAAQMLQLPAENLASAFAGAAEGAQHIASFNSQIAQTQVNLLAASSGLADYTSKLQMINTTLAENGFATQLPVLTTQQLAWAQALDTTGLSAEQVLAKVTALAEQANFLNAALLRNSEATGINALQADSLSVALSELQSRNEAGAAAASAYFARFQEGALSYGEVIAAIDNYIISNDAYIASKNEAIAVESAHVPTIEAVTAAITAQREEMTVSAQESLNDTYAKQEQAAMTEILRIQTEAAADAFAALHPAGTAAAAGLAAAEGRIPPLVARLLQARDAANQARAALIAFNNAANIKSAQQVVDNKRASGHTGMGASSDYQAGADAYNEQLRKRKDAELNLANAQGNTAKQLEILRQRQQGLNETSAEYINLQAQIIGIENKAAKAAGGGKKGKGGGGGAGKVSPADKLGQQQIQDQQKVNDKLEDEAEKHAEKMVDIEKDYTDKVLKIQKDFQAKELAQMKSNEQKKRNSRADFYEGLMDMPEGVDAAKYAAEYEKAFAEAQKLAQEGQHKLAEELLAMRTEQINQMRELDEKEAEIRGNEDLNEKEKERQLAYLEGVRKLREDAQAEELKQLREGGDDIVNERAKALEEAEKEYKEKLDDETNRYQDAYEKIMEGSERTQRKRMQDFDFAHKHIMAGLDAETQKAGTSPMTAPPTAANGGVPVPVPPTPTTVTPTGKKPEDAIIVRDDAVVSSLATLSTVMEGKLGEVVSSVDKGTAAIVARLNAVESAVKSIKIQTQRLVS